MGSAEVISLPEVRARKQWEALRQQLHERFDQWLDEVEAQLPASAPTLAQVTEFSVFRVAGIYVRFYTLRRIA